ncbi:kinase-like protein [Aspergillus sclerotiicarbonarius CBS 121057]|uniref:non-specific serine/threonine protein kinase n=1 Tax=Aspergillus sclerotiicarbonarius (strain CBS 121057 / IBT 28362) TaxID=1448318 RepID=A0A319EM83_ASPSB|nr:kinase-like protein [Aspergillus sclerotiicarbonarius CBS 121057]
MDSLRPGSEFWDVIKEIIHELKEHTKRRDEISSRFIRRHDLVRVWQNEDRIHKLLYNDRLTPEDVCNIQENFIAILSILVSIEATVSVRNFCSTFLTGTISDRDLPLEREQIEAFLPDHPALVLRFDDVQCEFCPVTIRCTVPQQSVHPKCRLPFVEPPTRLGVGGFGEVDLVAIAPRYWKVDGDADYDVAYKVACKKFMYNKHFRKEAENLRILKNSWTRQDHILHHYTTICHDPYNYILFPYAEKGDLNQLLLDGGGYYVFHERFPHVPAAGDSTIFKPLLLQCVALASAIHWLHNRIQVEANNIMCAHMDLKPENILIKEDGGSIVGKWMISDFGISVVEPHKGGFRPALSVGDWYRQLTIEAEPKHQRGTYLPPEAIHRGGSRVAGDKVGRQSDIWAYGCVFSEVLAWAIRRREGVDEFADLRERGTTSDQFWEESFGQSLSPQPTGFKIRDSVVTWIDGIRSTFPGALSVWAKTIKDILIIEKNFRPNAHELEEHVRRVYESCDLLSDNSSRPSTPADPQTVPGDRSVPGPNSPRPNSPRPNSPRPGSCSSGQNSLGITKIISHSMKHSVATSLSRTTWQGNVPAAVVSQDKIEIVELNLSQEIVRSVKELSLSPKWEDASVAIEGQYFAAWGYCKVQKKRTVSSLLRIGDISSSSEPNLPIDPGIVSSVAVSRRGVFALVRDKDIVLLSLPSALASSVYRCLAIPPHMEQTFTQAIFNDGGDMLFTWARGQRQESLYAWKMEREVGDVPDFVVHYSLHRFYLNTQVIPYNSTQGCVLAGDHNRYLAVPLKQPSTELPGLDRPYETIDLIASCLVGNEHFLGLVNDGRFGRTQLCLKRYKIDRREDQDIFVYKGKVCDIPKQFKPTNVMRAYEGQERTIVVLWHGTSILVTSI